MGALTPITQWIPEDDLLLKNAVEAGASLESLAKGAVCFSRRFTIRELQDRWYSLLYDSVTSAEASAHILEIELSVSNPPKSNQYCNIKGKECIPGKRKVDTVRSHYYAMRKRICNGPYNSVDLSFIFPPNDQICEGDYQEQLKFSTGNPAGSCMLGASIPNCFGLPETDFDVLHHAFPPMLRVDESGATNVDATNHGFHTGQVDSHENALPDGIMGNVSSVGKSVGNGISHSFEHDNLHKDIPQILGENPSVFPNCSVVQELGLPQTLPVNNLFQSTDLEARPFSNFSSPVSDCSDSFHQLEYSSPLPKLPWRAMEEISTPAMPVETNREDKKDIVTDVQKMNSQDYDVVHSEPKLIHGIPGDDELNSSTEGDFMDLSNALLDFSNDLLYIDVDEKDMIDRSRLDGLNSILLSSPNDGMLNASVPEASSGVDTCLVIPESSYPEELNAVQDIVQCDSEFNVPSTSFQNPHSSELIEGFIFCTLNTEDPEIPCNDDVFSPPEVLCPLAQGSSETNTSVLSLTKHFHDKQKASGQRLTLVSEGQETPSQPFVKSLIRGSEVLPEMGPQHPRNGHGLTVGFPENDALIVASKNIGVAGEDRLICTSVSVTPHSVPDVILKENLIKQEPGTHDNLDNSVDSFLDKKVQESDLTKCYHENAVGFCAPVVLQNNVTHEEPGSAEIGFPEPVKNISTSDHEELLSGSDDDVPYFSDIEAMILDMDLGPYDEESCFTREVSKYQYEDTKKAIIRLEQGAHSYMQRAMTSHGAFAIFYGRHLKHYIKKPEVSLGRATEDVNVDIDLGREGRANKISRRQAIIKMEEDGSFYLKNLGKCPILVNNKEVATGQRFPLSSSCLIEIRGMRFVFEMNRTFARQHSTNVAIKKSSQDKNTKFEWLPGEIP
ncbi:forkhead-associated (FHA) domain-containing protein isoform X2 [Tasmannia lanceolata]|uniref:forkhead-associated (FHA) domain-containing protein isoform X2 n=1 Tax=Tasmannia lanceolata TaxID=3420 RepID=UPI0040631151